MRTETVISDSLGQTTFDPESLPHVYAYNGDGSLASDTVSNGRDTWIKTYTYEGGMLTRESAWVKQ